jgi:hypothetical protein
MRRVSIGLLVAAGAAALAACGDGAPISPTGAGGTPSATTTGAGGAGGTDPSTSSTGSASASSASSGGASSSSAASSSAASSSAASSGAGGGTQAGGPISTTIPPSTNGAGEIRSSTTLLKNASAGGSNVYDFGDQRIGVNNTVACDGDDVEGQMAVFEVQDGVTVKNLIIAGGLHGGNGIICKGSCTLDHVYWEDVCEDAATNTKDGATMLITNSIALHASDKVFQHNAKGDSKTIVLNSYISDFGKLWRSCGDCSNNGGKRHLVLDNVKVEDVGVAVAGANQNYQDTVTITDLFVKGGYNASSDKPKICTEYIGVSNHVGVSTKVDGGKSQWDTAVCIVSHGDVKSW